MNSASPTTLGRTKFYTNPNHSNTIPKQSKPFNKLVYGSLAQPKSISIAKYIDSNAFLNSQPASQPASDYISTAQLSSTIQQQLDCCTTCTRPQHRRRSFIFASLHCIGRKGAVTLLVRLPGLVPIYSRANYSWQLLSKTTKPHLHRIGGRILCVADAW